MKSVQDIWREKIKGKNKIETAENLSILLIFLGAFFFSLGVGLTIISPQGFPAILAMLGASLSFLSTVALIFIWVLK
ncbi:MAG: hypothetical protein NZ942_00125 [Candidatus Aenigmarchaeota archaeon]|nr:hypothetical protein [Candidatus Aenigmarchaeota archaeon]